MLKIANAYGPVMEAPGTGVAQTLTRADKVSPLAVEYARKAEKGLTKDDSAESSVAVLKVLVSALTKTGKADDAKEFAATLTKLKSSWTRNSSAPLSRSRSKLPPARARAAAWPSSNCSPGPVPAVRLGRHRLRRCRQGVQAGRRGVPRISPAHPRPRPADQWRHRGAAEVRGAAIRGTPTAFVNGKVTEVLGGCKEHGEASFATLSQIIDQALETDDQGTLKLTVNRKGDKIEAEANVSDLKKTGEKVRLRFVLIEDVARYAGNNGQRLHHHVVRGLPGGLDGFEIKDGKATQKVLVNLGDLKKSLTEYLTESDKKKPFIDDDRPMDLKHLGLSP